MIVDSLRGWRPGFNSRRNFGRDEPQTVRAALTSSLRSPPGLRYSRHRFVIACLGSRPGNKVAQATDSACRYRHMLRFSRIVLERELCAVVEPAVFSRTSREARHEPLATGSAGSRDRTTGRARERRVGEGTNRDGDQTGLDIDPVMDDGSAIRAEIIMHVAQKCAAVLRDMHKTRT
jgi:hypothetical protein